VRIVRLDIGPMRAAQIDLAPSFMTAQPIHVCEEMPAEGFLQRRRRHKCCDEDVRAWSAAGWAIREILLTSILVVVGMNTYSDYGLIFLSLPDETSMRCTELEVSVDTVRLRDRHPLLSFILLPPSPRRLVPSCPTIVDHPHAHLLFPSMSLTRKGRKWLWTSLEKAG
jgi:hypothetical protein